MQKITLGYSSIFSSVSDFLQETLFPRFCLVCGKKTEKTYLCEDCKRQIRFLDYPLIDHERNTYFYAITEYSGIIKDAVLNLKFKSCKMLSKELALIIVEFLKKNEIHFDYVSFVPMTRKELLKRGFNQTFLLAKDIKRLTEAELFDKIYKVKDTMRQIELSKGERVVNLKEAFLVKESIKGDVLVIDDVFTTGSTAREIVKSLNRKIDGKIFFVALSRRIT